MRSSPHLVRPLGISAVMLWVVAASLPGLALLTWFYGWGNIINSLIAIVTALGAEAAFLAIRNRPVMVRLKDGSALLTGLLLGLSLPPFAPWWVTFIATVFAIVLVKQLYGGLGQNLFNPAMAAFALVLISFPLPMTTSWAAPDGLQDIAPPGFSEQLAIQFEQQNADGYTMATPLDVYKNKVAQLTQTEILELPSFSGGWFNGMGWVNLAYLLGGIVLIWRGVISWHIPVGVLAGLIIPALLLSSDPDSALPVSMHLFAGATMLGAFFIATDPASAATSNRGKLYYGLGIGLLVYLIRTWGNYPDAVAFAVLLMNFAAPLLDHFSRPRVYGHDKAVKGYSKPEEPL